MLRELNFYNDIVDRIKDLPDVKLVLAKVDASTLAHFMLRELNLLRDGQDLADRELQLGTDATMEQALGIATIQMLRDVIESRDTSLIALQEALQSLARNQLTDIASSRLTTEWMLPHKK